MWREPTRGRHLRDGHVLLVGHEAQDGEDGEAGDEARAAVQETQRQAVPADTRWSGLHKRPD